MTLDVLVLRLDAPLQSFGDVVVDQRGATRPFPGLSMVAGLLGNALGYHHADVSALHSLQDRLRLAVRCDRPGVRVTDFQTVDLGRPFMVEGWTTRGYAETRGHGSSDTHIRYRDYWADAVFTVALTLNDPATGPSVAGIARALSAPERPLFIGRKACLPAAPLLAGVVEAPSLLAALSRFPRIGRERWRGSGDQPLEAWVPGDEDVEVVAEEIPVVDERDWANQLVVGRRIVKRTWVSPPEGDHAG